MELLLLKDTKGARTSFAGGRRTESVNSTPKEVPGVPRSVARSLVVPRLLIVALFVVSLVASPGAFAASAPPELLDAARLRLSLERLRVVGTALYVGAHPDDENTALLSWLASGRKVRTVYLSLTRGDGGQNLIGSETKAELGILRTDELLAARRIDGAEQLFTRAVDFGFSKNPEEALETWGREEVLSDVVRAIRRLRPDVVVTRFPSTGEGGHGHHTASAILAKEAFRAAADPKRFPEQIAEGLGAWQAKRLVWNAWQREAGEGPPLPPVPAITVDVGGFDPLLGRSHSEIAAESRSLHKSQGFGTGARRGSIRESLEPVDGDPARSDLFDGVELGWKRFRGGGKVDRLLGQALKRLDPERPHEVVPFLLEALDAMGRIPSEPILEAKRRELLEVVRSAAGLWIEAIAAAPSGVPGSSIRVALGAIDRSGLPLVLERIELPLGVTEPLPPLPRAKGSRWSPVREPSPERPVSRALAKNAPLFWDTAIRIPDDAEPTIPDWLREPAAKGLFVVRDPKAIGRPEGEPVTSGRFLFALGKRRFALEAPLLHRSVDPVEGERYRPFEVAPPVSFRIEPRVVVRAGTSPSRIVVSVKGAAAPLEGTVRFVAPAGWSVEPGELAVAFRSIGEEIAIELLARPDDPKSPAGALAVRFEDAAKGRAGEGVPGALRSAGHSSSFAETTIDHPHVPVRTLFRPAEIRLVAADLASVGGAVGYVMGPGDFGPEALRQLGHEVELLGDDELARGDLSRFRAIVVGVRALNVRPRLLSLMPRLHGWVADGGNLVVQYQTADFAFDGRLAPKPMRIGGERVTVEEAPVRLPNPGHPLLTLPNRIGPSDFEGWVQERGLDFATGLDPAFEPLLAMNDPGENETNGSLVFLRYGKGSFVYTGLSLFRQLPAGVPGAWRLFENLVAGGRGAEGR
jgi:LmbE family N-acetylglucosaminyl deacetylase